MNENPRSITRGFIRAFRNGVAFGTRLKLSGINPKNILELGAGDGYFARGIKFVFPEVKVTCLDIVDEVLEHIRTHHSFQTIKGTPETIDNKKHHSYDLIIARDVIEHLAKPLEALKKIKSLLTNKGYLHFIVPNGREDYWGHHLNWHINQKASEMLLNHVNYFNPVGMQKILLGLNLKPVLWYNYDFKGTRQGYGWKIHQKLAGAPSVKRSATKTIQECKSLQTSFEEVNPHKVLQLWWLKIPRIFGMAYCYLKHYPMVKLNANRGIGHEIFCLAQNISGE